MKLKTVLLIAMAVLLPAILGMSKSSTLTQKPEGQPNKKKWDDPTTLRARVKKEKDKGVQRVSFPAPVMEYPEVDLATALAETTVIIADVTEKESRLMDPKTIGTFYRLTIVETLSKPSPPGCCSLKDEDFPTDLPALGENEMYMAGIGGTLIVDGVDVTVEEDFKELLPYRRYLLFLSPTSSGKFSAGKIGPKGVFLVKSDGELEPIVNKSFKLRRDLERTFYNSLIQLKEGTKRKG